MTYKDEQQELLRDYAMDHQSLSGVLAKNFDMSTQDTNGENLLHYAIRYNKEDDVKAILENNLININKPTSALNTPLHIACKQKHIYLIELLLKFKAKPNLQNQNGETPFFLLQHLNNNFFNSDLITKYNIDLNIYNSDGVTLFNDIVRQGLYSTIYDILENKSLCNIIEWNSVDKNNNNLITSLIISHQNTSNNKHYDYLIKKFIKYGASINHINMDGEKPIIYAIKNYNSQMVELLYNNGADLSCVNAEKRSLGNYLTDAMIEINRHITLNNNHNSLNKLNNNREQLLKIEAFIQKEKLYTPTIDEIKKILKEAIKSKNTNNIKESYLKYISESEDKQQLLDYCLLICLNDKSLKLQTANFFIKNGADINSQLIHTDIKIHGNYKELPIFLNAIYNNRPDSLRMMSYMLKNNYNPTIDKNSDNYNALHCMSQEIIHKSNNLAEAVVMEEILKTQVNINEQCTQGNTPLHILLNKNKLHERLPIVELLIKQKPLLNIKNKKEISVYEKCISALSELKISHNPQLENTKEEILASIQNLYLEQNISQKQMHTTNKLKI